MRDPITDAAQDPSCLLCLTPDRSGSWWSRLRPAMPRDFAVEPMEWREFSAVAAAVGTDGFTLKITFNRPSKTAGYLFYGAHFFGFMLAATNILCRISADNYVFIEEAVVGDLSGRHTLKMTRRQGGVDYYLDGALVKTNATAWDVDLSLVFTAGRYLTTDLDGTVESIALMNDTTGETVWQAAYSDLYDTSNPWPSPVPRNFAEEPMTWRDEKTTAPSIGEDDCEFFIRYRLDGYPEGSAISQIFYHNSQNGSINIAFAGDGTGGNYSVIRLTDTDGVVIPLDRVRQLGEHTIRVRRVGLTVTVEFDGEVAATSTGTEKVAVYSTTAPVSDFDGVIFETYWKSLTTGRTVWSYPSDAERVRLITKTNVRTDRGAFEAADENISAGVVTQLDLRGNTTSKTFWARGYFPKHANTGVLYIYPLIGQGDIVLGPDAWVFRVTAWEDNRTTSGAINLRCDFCDADNVARLCYIPITDDFFNVTHDIAYVIDFQANGAFCSVYIDGLVAVQKNFTASAFGAGATSAMSANVGIRQDPIQNYLSGNSVECALVFDRALSAAEIAALTPKRQPLSWAGIRDVVRRGRAQRYFAVGDVLTVATPRWTIEYEVTGFDQVEPADAALTHSMTLLPVRLVTNLQFDAPEPGNPDANRAQYGCNRWDWSAIRQWMNSAAAPGEWWTAQHEYDAAPAYAATLAGFMADLPADFLSAVAPARLVTTLSNADGGGSVETVDRFWPPSRTEIFGALDGGMPEGAQMTKYVGATDADRIKYTSAGTASGWGLRSPNRSNSYNIVNVSANGIMQELSRSSAWSSGIVPACIIA